jgi:hypothetical protein
MYYVFQQKDEISSVLFYESCETQEECDELVAIARYPVIFTYDDVSGKVEIVTDYYDLQECFKIISSLLK